MNFEKEFNDVNKKIKILIFINLLMRCCIFGIIIYLIYYIINDPKIIGEFFGKINNGFQSIK